MSETTEGRGGGEEGKAKFKKGFRTMISIRRHRIPYG